MTCTCNDTPHTGVDTAGWGELVCDKQFLATEQHTGICVFDAVTSAADGKPTLCLTATDTSLGLQVVWLVCQ